MKTKINFKNVFPSITSARYNVAAWQKPDSGNIILIGRDVLAPGKPGEPDIGSLVLSEFNKDGQIIYEYEVWKPREGSYLLEDPRAITESNGEIVIGLTALFHGENKTEAFPAFVKLSPDWHGELPPVTIIPTFGPGKNMTPIGHDHFVFRPEGEEYNHKLILFKFLDNGPEKVTELVFPNKLSWADWRAGTTMPPIWMPDATGIFFIHGISKKEGKYIYSIGLAKLISKDDSYIIAVSPEPILTPDSFLDENGKPITEELRPDERRVVYACGGILDKNSVAKLKLFVNVGDRITVEVTFILEEILERLNSSDLIFG